MAGLGKKVKIRLIVVLGILTLLTAALLVRSAYIVIADGEELHRKAMLQQNRGTTTSPRRGTIYDRNGKELAISIPVETITVSPNDLRKSKKPIEEIAAELATILGLDTEAVLEKLVKDSFYQVLKEKVDKQVGDEIRAWAKEKSVKGIYIIEDFKRVYPRNNLAAHVVGFTRSDNEGLSGIEKTMEKFLKGVPGKVVGGVDKSGRSLPFDSNRNIDIQDGYDVVLTMDETIQYYAEESLQRAIQDNDIAGGGVVIVMDPRNGDILAMVSKPDFDLNNPWACPPGADSSLWKGTTTEDVEILEKTVWRNKAIMDTYEPGSTFKAITAAAALEENIIHPDSPVNDFPVSIGNSNPINCWKLPVHGEETFKEGVYNSCNPVFVKLSQQMGIEKFYSYMKLFGFYDKTGIALTGESNAIHHTNPQVIDMAVTSFGENFQITPIQLISSYTALANGGKLMKPRLVSELRNSKGEIVQKFEPEVVREVISRKTSDTMRELLEGVVTYGTGNKAYVNGYRVAGKTGTADTLQEGVVTASFSSFAPADNPVVCVLMVLFDPAGEKRGGGATAAPAVGRLIENILNYMEVERRYSDKDMESMTQEVAVPELRGTTLKEAKNTLAGMGLDYIAEGDTADNNDIVQEQFPKPGERLPKKSRVVLYTYKPENEVSVKVPDLAGKTVAEATEALKKEGLNIRVDGVGIVARQKPDPDTEVFKGSVVEVEFRDDSNIE